MSIDKLIVTGVIHGYAGRLSYSPDGEMICFDKIDEEDENRYFDLWTMTSEGHRRKNLTKDKRFPFTSRHIGQPAYHPNGEFIVYQAQKQDSATSWDALATPGSGMMNDLYVMSSNGRQTIRVYECPSGKGVLHPHFNADGTKLCWSEYVGTGVSDLGHWVLKQAQFIGDNILNLGLMNIQTTDIGLVPDWLENHGYDTVDDRFIVFSGNPDGQSSLRSNIYVFNTLSLELIKLTDNNNWEEHAHFSPNGEWIVFMRGLTEDVPLSELETELWIMKNDGSRQQQLTYFHTPDHPHFVRETGLVCADSDWHPDGMTIAVFTQDRLSNQGDIRFCSLDYTKLD